MQCVKEELGCWSGRCGGGNRAVKKDKSAAEKRKLLLRAAFAEMAES